jgi:hypothetical protein
MSIFDVIEDHLGLKSYLDHTQTYKWPFYAIQKNVPKNVQILLSSKIFFLLSKIYLIRFAYYMRSKKHMHISKEGENKVFCSENKQRERECRNLALSFHCGKSKC